MGKMLFEPCVCRLAEEGLSRSAVVVGLIIASFCKGREGIYYGSREYLAELVGVSVRTVQRAVHELVRRGFVERVTKNGHQCLRVTPSLMGEKKKTGSEDVEKKCDKTVKNAEISEQKSDDMPKISGQRSEATLPKEMPSEKMPREVCNPVYPREPYKYAYESEGLNVKYKMLELGREGYVQMTPRQYEELLKLAPSELVRSYIIRFEKMLAENMFRGGEVKAPHSHYHTIKKWMHADLSV